MTTPSFREYRRVPSLRVGALVRMPNGSIGRIKTLDPQTDTLEIEPAPRWLLVVRRWLGKWDRREPTLRGEYVSSSVKDVAGLDPLLPLGDFYPARTWWSRWLCTASLHDWRNGPGQNCVECGAHDYIFCACDACTRRREKR